MARPSKIVSLDLEQTVISGREKALTTAQIVKRCNDRLAKDGGEKPPTVSVSAVERYLTSLPAVEVEVAHRPQEGERSFALAIDFGGQFLDLNQKLTEWIEEAHNGRRIGIETTGKGDSKVVHEIDLGPDWQARTSVARELREHLGQYTDLMERIYSIAQVQEFQAAVLAEIEDAAPEVAAKIRDRLQARQSIRQSILLGRTGDLP